MRWGILLPLVAGALLVAATTSFANPEERAAQQAAAAFGLVAGPTVLEIHNPSPEKSRRVTFVRNADGSYDETGVILDPGHTFFVTLRSDYSIQMERGLDLVGAHSNSAEGFQAESKVLMLANQSPKVATLRSFKWPFQNAGGQEIFVEANSYFIVPMAGQIAYDVPPQLELEDQNGDPLPITARVLGAQ